MPTPARPDLLDAVERVTPIIRAHSAQAEEERRIPATSYQAMQDAGLFDMIAPAAHGGLEVHPTEALAVWEAVARVDVSHAWNLVMNQAIAGFVAWLPAEGAQELLQDGPTTVAGVLNPPTAAIRVDGGWRVSGQAPFASGCHNARWLVMPAIEMDGDGPKLDPDTGEPSPMAVFFPREEAEILDTWDTVGMRGTGSADIRVQDLFVPDHRCAAVARLETPAPGFEGPLYRFFPWAAVLGESICSVGVAAQAVEDLLELVQTKVPAYQQIALRDQPLAQYGAARAKARVDAARDTLYRAADEAYEQVSSGDLLDIPSKIRLQLACSFAADICVEAVRAVSDVAGSSSIRAAQPFERYVRDVHTLSQHASKSNPRYATAGQLLFGLDNDWLFLTF